MATSEISRYLTSNPLTVFNTLLLIFTAYLSYNSFIFQTRTSIRESIEQLEDIEFRRGKIRPILHSYEYSLLSNSQCIVQLKYYSDGKNPANANQPRGTFRHTRYWLAQRLDSQKTGEPIDEELFLKAVEENIPAPRGEMEVYIRDIGILLYINSSDAVYIRRLTEGVMEHLYQTLMQGPEDMVKDLELEDEI